VVSAWNASELEIGSPELVRLAALAAAAVVGPLVAVSCRACGWSGGVAAATAALAVSGVWLCAYHPDVNVKNRCR
jgi:hypothetical protein